MEEEQVIRIGIVDFDSSHAVEFTRRLNHLHPDPEQWVDGARVVAGCALPSAIADPARVEGFVRTFTHDFQLPFVGRPEELIGQVDAVLIESVDGSVHAERARPFLEAGIPTFIDKPMTCSLAEARELFHLAEERSTPLFSSSSLRYADEVTAARGADAGRILGCDAYSPASTHPRNPGLFHYGIHGVETLFALMGAGCETVWCASEEGAEVAVGRWSDGRIGSVRGTRSGAHAYGFTAFGERRVLAQSIGTGAIYRNLLREIVRMLQTGEPPVDPRETLEVIGFIEAVLLSAREGGAPRRIGL